MWRRCSNVVLLLVVALAFALPAAQAKPTFARLSARDPHARSAHSSEDAMFVSSGRQSAQALAPQAQQLNLDGPELPQVAAHNPPVASPSHFLPRFAMTSSDPEASQFDETEAEHETSPMPSNSVPSPSPSPSSNIHFLSGESDSREGTNADLQTEEQALSEAEKERDHEMRLRDASWAVDVSGGDDDEPEQGKPVPSPSSEEEHLFGSDEKDESENENEADSENENESESESESETHPSGEAAAVRHSMSAADVHEVGSLLSRLSHEDEQAKRREHRFLQHAMKQGNGHVSDSAPVPHGAEGEDDEEEGADQDTVQREVEAYADAHAESENDPATTGLSTTKPEPALTEEEFWGSSADASTAAFLELEALHSNERKNSRTHGRRTRASRSHTKATKPKRVAKAPVEAESEVDQNAEAEQQDPMAGLPSPGANDEAASYALDYVRQAQEGLNNFRQRKHEEDRQFRQKYGKGHKKVVKSKVAAKPGAAAKKSKTVAHKASVQAAKKASKKVAVQHRAPKVRVHVAKHTARKAPPATHVVERWIRKPTQAELDEQSALAQPDTAADENAAQAGSESEAEAEAAESSAAYADSVADQEQQAQQAEAQQEGDAVEQPSEDGAESSEEQQDPQGQGQAQEDAAAQEGDAESSAEDSEDTESTAQDFQQARFAADGPNGAPAQATQTAGVAGAAAPAATAADDDNAPVYILPLAPIGWQQVPNNPSGGGTPAAAPSVPTQPFPQGQTTNAVAKT